MHAQRATAHAPSRRRWRTQPVLPTSLLMSVLRWCVGRWGADSLRAASRRHGGKVDGIERSSHRVTDKEHVLGHRFDCVRSGCRGWRIEWFGVGAYHAGVVQRHERARAPCRTDPFGQHPVRDELKRWEQRLRHSLRDRPPPKLHRTQRHIATRHCGDMPEWHRHVLHRRLGHHARKPMAVAAPRPRHRMGRAQRRHQHQHRRHTRVRGLQCHLAHRRRAFHLGRGRQLPLLRHRHLRRRHQRRGHALCL